MVSQVYIASERGAFLSLSLPTLCHHHHPYPCHLGSTLNLGGNPVGYISFSILLTIRVQILPGELRFWRIRIKILQWLNHYNLPTFLQSTEMFLMALFPISVYKGYIDSIFDSKYYKNHTSRDGMTPLFRFFRTNL